MQVLVIKIRSVDLRDCLFRNAHGHDSRAQRSVPGRFALFVWNLRERIGILSKGFELAFGDIPRVLFPFAHVGFVLAALHNRFPLPPAFGFFHAALTLVQGFNLRGHASPSISFLRSRIVATGESPCSAAFPDLLPDTLASGAPSFEGFLSGADYVREIVNHGLPLLYGARRGGWKLANDGP